MDYRGFALSANISIMFTEWDYLDRMKAARSAGFTSVETWWPFRSPDPGQREVDTLLRALAESDVALTGLNLYAGDMAAGERGVACRPERQAELEANLPVVASIAERTGCRRFNLLYGQLEDHLDASDRRDCAAQAYRATVGALEAVQGIVLIEPLARD